MAVDNFTVGQSITTTDNFVDVTVTPGTAPLPQGTHHFQLVVVDEAGKQGVQAFGHDAAPSGIANRNGVYGSR